MHHTENVSISIVTLTPCLSSYSLLPSPIQSSQGHPPDQLAYALNFVNVCLLIYDFSFLQDRSISDVFGSHYDEGRVTRVLDQDPIWAILSKRSIDRHREIEKKTGVYQWRTHFPRGKKFS